MTDNPEITHALSHVVVNGNAGTVTMSLFVYEAILDTIAVLQEQVEAKELEIRKQDETIPERTSHEWKDEIASVRISMRGATMQAEDTGISNGFEAMKAELREAGYRFTTIYKHPDSVNLWFFEVRSKSGWIWRDSGHYHADEVDNTRMIEGVINEAWKHYQREKQFEAMRKLLAEMANDKSQSWEDDYKDEIYWRNRAGRLLATIAKGESMKSDVE